MLKFAESRPLLSVLIAALAVRLLSVFWSEGFIHSDDHFDTIAVAWEWLNGGWWGANGFLRWKHELSDTIGRFPLYTLALWAEMKGCQLLGMTSLGSMMYVIRFTHALVSLLPVWAVFEITRRVTGSVRWAMVGGLMVGFHFAMPFLGVRNSIESVGGSLWVVALLFLYRYRDDSRVKWLYLAGLMTGLAWMIRFPLAFAVLPVPFILWWETKRLRPALHYSLAVGTMILIAATTDYWLLGNFAASARVYLSMDGDYGALYRTIPMLYPILLILLLVPPFSLVMLYVAGRPNFVKRHLILVGSTVSFIVIHWIHPNQQERFMFPILGAMLLIVVLALHQYMNDREEHRIFLGWRRVLLGTSLTINLVLLAGATVAYGHRGMIEPVKWFEANDPDARVLFMQPEIKRWVPNEYGGEELSRFYVRKWDDLARAASEYDYFVLYPKRPDDLEPYLDSLQSRFGALEPFMEIEPSGYDQLLHVLNRKHNDNFAAHIYRSR